MYFLMPEDHNVVVCDNTAIPRNSAQWEEYLVWCEAGNVASLPPVPQMTLEEMISVSNRTIESWLDGFVQQRNYKSIESCISYVDDEDLFFAAEALAAKRWRSAVYSAARTMMKNPPVGVTPGNITEHLPQPETFGWPEQLVTPISLEAAPLLPEA